MLAAQMLMGKKPKAKNEVNFFNRTGPIKIMNNAKPAYHQVEDVLNVTDINEEDSMPQRRQGTK